MCLGRAVAIIRPQGLSLLVFRIAARKNSVHDGKKKEGGGVVGKVGNVAQVGEKESTNFT